MTSPTARTEDARALYQQRLCMFYRVGFALSVSFLLGVVVIRGLLGSGLDRELRSVSRWFHIGATVVAGVMWLSLRGRPRSLASLAVVDVAGMLGLTTLLNLNAGLFGIRTVAVFNLVLATGVAMVLRAVLVPSTTRRTLVLGLAASAVATAVFFVSALAPWWPVHQLAPADWPLSFQLISLLLWLGTLVATATVTSRVIYDLRREVHAARRLGQYVLGDKLGEGGMGVVFRATHSMLRRETAIKLLLPERINDAALRRFEREVVNTARLRHPNTVAIFDYGRTLDGVFYYAMEFLDGLTITGLVEAEGALPAGRVVGILAQVCGSLEEAHAMGLVHRDIKPANVMVVGRIAAYDLVKVLDFGLVKDVEPEVDGGASLTQGGRLVGTPQYLAPEAITDPDRVDLRCDLYAVAAVGYYMLTGHPVFDADNVVELCAAHLHEPVPPMRERLGRDVPADLEAVLARALAKDPGERPASAAELRAELLACAVPAWTAEQAQAWWEQHREAPRRAAATGSQGVHETTIRIQLDRG